MPRPIRKATETDLEKIKIAYQMLDHAMMILREAGAHKSANYVGRCRKSTWGAIKRRPRHSTGELFSQLLVVVKRVSAYEEARRSKNDQHFHDEELDAWKALIAKAEGR